MRSSKGEYYVGLDHIRAFAAFTVFAWHFNHVNNGQLDPPPIFPLSFFTEGHIGVALFMTLSGYLFAKLIGEKRVRYFPFLWNRVLRLFPLLAVTFFITGIQQVVLNGYPAISFISLLGRGFVTPEWPNGGWSIAVEMHFYIILPVLLLASSRNAYFLFLALPLSALIRCIYWWEYGEVQSVAYWTILGCIDQFVLGILAWKFHELLSNKHGVAAFSGVILLVFIYYFDYLGGFYKNVEYPSPSAIWIVGPAVVGACFAVLIAWYDCSFRFEDRGIIGAVSKIGACSYSIYLLHFFIVFRVSDYIDENIFTLSSTPRMLLAAGIVFVLFSPLAYLSFRLIELPPLKYRRKYLD